jgi:hypothetical protein
MKVLASGLPGDDAPRPPANGAANGKPVRFSLVKGAWQKIALKYNGGGKECIAPRSKERQMYYTLYDGRAAYFPHAVGLAIDSLRQAPGQDFWIRYNGGDDWDVERNNPEVPAPAAAAPAAQRTVTVGGAPAGLTGSCQPSVGKVVSRQSTVHSPATDDSRLTTNDYGKPAPETLDTIRRNEAIMRRCYLAAIAVCLDAVAAAREQNLPVAPNFDSIERTAVSMFIAETRG